MDITFDTENYLAKVDFTEAELDRLCVKKAEVIGVSSRQSVKILCEGKEYEDVPVWMHTDCGARHWYMKGLEAVEKGNEPPTASTAAEYFKDAALMFPFPGNVLVQESPYEQFQTITPYVLVVFLRIDREPPAEDEYIAKGVINILSSVRWEHPDPTAHKTYRPFLKFRFRHRLNVSTILHSRTYLYDLLEERVAKIPTWNYDKQAWELPIKDLGNLADDVVTQELALFLDDAVYIPESRLVLNALTKEHHGTTASGVESIFPYQNGWQVSTCNGETLNPGWEGTYTPANERAGGWEYDFSCKCGFGTIYESALKYQDQSFHTNITYFSHYKGGPDKQSSLENVENYATFSLGRYRDFTVDAETEWISAAGECVCGYNSGYADMTTSARYRAVMPDQEPVIFILEGIRNQSWIIAPECFTNSITPDYPEITCAVDIGNTEYGWHIAEKNISGKLWFEVGATFRGNFFLECDTVNLLHAASYTQQARVTTVRTEGVSYGFPYISYVSTITVDYPFIESDINRVAFDGQTGRGFLNPGPAMLFITNVIADYHDALIAANYFNSNQDTLINNVGIGWCYLYMNPPETIKAEIALQGLYFVPFNRELALFFEKNP